MKKTITSLRSMLLLAALLCFMSVQTLAADTPSQQTLDTLEARLVAAWQACETQVELTDLDLPDDWIGCSLVEFYSQCSYDHPEFYHLGTGNIGWQSSISGTFLRLPAYTATKAQLRQLQNKIDQILAECLSPGMSDADIALVLHDYLALNCAYNKSSSAGQNIFTAYGALMEQNAVCEGYSLAYNALLHRAGIPAKYVGSDLIDHGWSLVKLGDKWYHVDVTWDDPVVGGYDVPGFVCHDNFLQSGETFRASHSKVEGNTAYYDHRVLGRNGEGLLEQTDARYESGQIFNGAETPFLPVSGGYAYLTQSGAPAVVNDLETWQQPPLDNAGEDGAIRVNDFHTLACLDGELYYTALISATTARIYRYDRDRDASQLLQTVTADRWMAGLQAKDGALQLLQAEASAAHHSVVARVEDLNYYDGTADFALNADHESGKLTLWAYNGTGKSCPVAVCLVGYRQNGQFAGCIWQTITLESNSRTPQSITTPSWFAEAQRIQLLMPDQGACEPLVNALPVR